MRIGMDFGTTNSGVARYDGARLRHLPLDDAAPNPQVARSALYITHDRQLHFGRAAIDRFYEQNLNRPAQMERVLVGEIELTFAELPAAGRSIRSASAMTEIAAGNHTVALTGERLLPLPAPARNGQLPLRPGERLFGFAEFADWQS